MNRERPTKQAFHIRFGADADCIGTETECQRPPHSADLDYCRGCPSLVVRYAAAPHPQGRYLAPHPEGGDATRRLAGLGLAHLVWVDQSTGKESLR